MSRAVVHKRTGTVKGWEQDVPTVLCPRVWVERASLDDSKVTCKNCLRLLRETPFE